MFVFCFLLFFFPRHKKPLVAGHARRSTHMYGNNRFIIIASKYVENQFSKPRWRRLSKPGRRRQFVNWAPMWRILVDLPRWDVPLASKTAHGGRKGRSILVEGRPGNFIETLAAFENKRSASWACSCTGDSRHQLPYPGSCLPYPFTCIPWAVVVYRKVR